MKFSVSEKLILNKIYANNKFFIAELEMIDHFPSFTKITMLSKLINDIHIYNSKISNFSCRFVCDGLLSKATSELKTLQWAI